MGQINNGYKPVTTTVSAQQTTVISRSYGLMPPKPTQRLYDDFQMLAERLRILDSP